MKRKKLANNESMDELLRSRNKTRINERKRNCLKEIISW